MSDPTSQAHHPITIAVFGGAFDPFHMGHATVIAHLLATPGIDRVVVVPSGDRPDKRGGSDACDRLAMTQRGVHQCFPGDTRVEVSDIQVSGRVGFGTIDLAQYYRETSGIRPLFVIGQELVKDLPLWKNAQALRENAEFVVVRRPGSKDVTELPGWKLTIAPPFDGGGIQVSSTDLRERLGRGEPCSAFLPESVRAYCVDRKLYSGR
jgi:nicotinate-nucleotide adenylyltransferase